MAFPIVNGTEVLVEPPGNYHVNFTHPFKDTATINSSYWAFGIEFSVAFLFLMQRIYTATFIVRRWRSDDYMILAAWLLTTFAQCLVLHCLKQGVLGVHIWEMSLEDAIWETTLIHATTLTVIPGTVLAKLVLCIFYYRLSPIVWYRYAIIATSFITIAAFTAVWFAVQFACSPISAAWNLRLYTGTNCIDRPPVYMLQAIMGGVTDIMLMVLPLPIILRLQMSWKHKTALIAWFGTGLITLGAAVARLVILIPSLKNSDTTFVLAQGTLWLIVEANLIIICGSLPTSRIFLNQVAPKILGESAGRSSNGNKGTPPAGMRYALRTFGSSEPKRRHFDTIDELELGDRPYGSEVRWKADADVAGSASTRNKRKNHCEGSDEEAIVKTVHTGDPSIFVTDTGFVSW
ncbi:hypothetical protein CORC01_07871 [Colletotrichum orchidophilum]|uniref:Rhodopsin domain-containing protein n=1 Tax=Colletotrichum orchidophilum TaxID=1209926 RepID=A0A1G4B679_9PEZI|nr:uncharacterized protein CORC01_07871 [Colletotrichum orchidophilum]OHE96904.1 hypothetical protein CORC01_07871 [Colletotrichum orchidophilum]